MVFGAAKLPNANFSWKSRMPKRRSEGQQRQHRNIDKGGDDEFLDQDPILFESNNALGMSIEEVFDVLKDLSRSSKGRGEDESRLPFGEYAMICADHRSPRNSDEDQELLSNYFEESRVQRHMRAALEQEVSPIGPSSSTRPTVKSNHKATPKRRPWYEGFATNNSHQNHYYQSFRDSIQQNQQRSSPLRFPAPPCESSSLAQFDEGYANDAHACVAMLESVDDEPSMDGSDEIVSDQFEAGDSKEPVPIISQIQTSCLLEQLSIERAMTICERPWAVMSTRDEEEDEDLSDYYMVLDDISIDEPPLIRDFSSDPHLQRITPMNHTNELRPPLSPLNKRSSSPFQHYEVDDEDSEIVECNLQDDCHLFVDWTEDDNLADPCDASYFPLGEESGENVSPGSSKRVNLPDSQSTSVHEPDMSWSNRLYDRLSNHRCYLLQAAHPTELTSKSPPPAPHSGRKNVSSRRRRNRSKKKHGGSNSSSYMSRQIKGKKKTRTKVCKLAGTFHLKLSTVYEADDEEDVHDGILSTDDEDTQSTISSEASNPCPSFQTMTLNESESGDTTAMAITAAESLPAIEI